MSISNDVKLIVWMMIAFTAGCMYTSSPFMTLERFYNGEFEASVGMERPECETRMLLEYYEHTCSSEDDLFARALANSKKMFSFVNCTIMSGSFYFWMIDAGASSGELVINTNHKNFVLRKVPDTKHVVTKTSSRLVDRMDVRKYPRGKCSTCGINGPFKLWGEYDEKPFVQHCCLARDGATTLGFKWREYINCTEAKSFAQQHLA